MEEMRIQFSLTHSVESFFQRILTTFPRKGKGQKQEKSNKTGPGQKHKQEQMEKKHVYVSKEMMNMTCALDAALVHSEKEGNKPIFSYFARSNF